MTSEVKSDLGNQLSDLDYICSHVFLASKCFHELNQTRRRRKVSQRPASRSAHAGKNCVEKSVENSVEKVCGDSIELSPWWPAGRKGHLPRGQVQSGSKAPEDLDLGLGPEAADGVPDAPDNGQPRRVLLRRRNHELEKVLDLLVQPGEERRGILFSLSGAISTRQTLFNYVQVLQPAHIFNFCES